MLPCFAIIEGQPIGEYQKKYPEVKVMDVVTFNVKIAENSLSFLNVQNNCTGDQHAGRKGDKSPEKTLFPLFNYAPFIPPCYRFHMFSFSILVLPLEPSTPEFPTI